MDDPGTAIHRREPADGLEPLRRLGLSFNNNYAGLALGLSGTAYLGVIGGIVALRGG